MSYFMASGVSKFGHERVTFKRFMTMLNPNKKFQFEHDITAKLFCSCRMIPRVLQNVFLEISTSQVSDLIFSHCLLLSV